MNKYTSDTNELIGNRQLALIRKLTVAQRFNLTCSLTHSVIQLSRKAIGRSFPKLDEKGIDLKFIELNYGKELAKKFNMSLKAEKR
ncbi:MAG: hypothetical protein WAX69_00855 [Victivallales bacterium]